MPRQTYPLNNLEPWKKMVEIDNGQLVCIVHVDKDFLFYFILFCVHVCVERLLKVTVMKGKGKLCELLHLEL